MGIPCMLLAVQTKRTFEVIVEVQVVVIECTILLWVEDLEQRIAGSPRKSVDILSISSNRKTGLDDPAFFND